MNKRDELTFLVWNVGNRKTADITACLSDILSKNDYHFLILNEYLKENHSSVLSNYDEILYAKMGSPKYSRIFFKKNSNISYTKPLPLFNNKILFSKIKYKTKEFNLCAVHLPSQYGGKSAIKQIEEFSEFSQDLIKYENSISINDKTILAGDFNSKPFEPLLNSSQVLIGLNSIELIEHFESQNVKEKNKLFYNPMWNYLGDISYNPKLKKNNPGTIFHNHNFDPEKFYWNMIDGVMFRKSIAKSFLPNDLEILTDVNTHQLVDYSLWKSKNTIISREQYSDHLPIKFKINSKKI